MQTIKVTAGENRCKMSLGVRSAWHIGEFPLQVAAEKLYWFPGMEAHGWWSPLWQRPEIPRKCNIVNKFWVICNIQWSSLKYDDIAAHCCPLQYITMRGDNSINILASHVVSYTWRHQLLREKVILKNSLILI